MAEDLLTRIQRELQERTEKLHGAVQERDRLQAELRALDVALESPAAVLSFPTRREPARAPATPPAADRRMSGPARPLRRHAVSPKVARLMLAPRRPALERPGIARVGARAGRVDVSSREMVGELDSEAELFEQSL